MRNRIIILSDLWGSQKADWINQYTERLKADFDIQYYDCCELGQIELTPYQQDYLHQQFINGGIEVASRNLLALEKEHITVLAFSIGGTIAWKAALNGLKIDQLFAISSTRLRYEIEKPKTLIKTYFGSEDLNRPNENWFNELDIELEIIKNKGHVMYREQSCIDYICNEILKRTLRK